MAFNILTIISFVLSLICTMVLSLFVLFVFKLKSDRARKLEGLKHSFVDFSQIGGFNE